MNENTPKEAAASEAKPSELTGNRFSSVAAVCAHYGMEYIEPAEIVAWIRERWPQYVSLAEKELRATPANGAPKGYDLSEFDGHPIIKKALADFAAEIPSTAPDPIGAPKGALSCKECEGSGLNRLENTAKPHCSVCGGKGWIAAQAVTREEFHRGLEGMLAKCPEEPSPTVAAETETPRTDAFLLQHPKCTFALDHEEFRATFGAIERELAQAQAEKERAQNEIGSIQILIFGTVVPSGAVFEEVERIQKESFNLAQLAESRLAALTEARAKLVEAEVDRGNIAMMLGDTRRERDELKSKPAEMEKELHSIDNVMARRPAMDQSTRAANVEKAISLAGKADDALGRLKSAERDRDSLRAQLEAATAENFKRATQNNVLTTALATAVKTVNAMMHLQGTNMDHGTRYNAMADLAGEFLRAQQQQGGGKV